MFIKKKNACFLINKRNVNSVRAGKGTDSKNTVTKLKNQSMRCYFYELELEDRTKYFWPTIKLFLSKKGQNGGTPVMLSEAG